MPAQTKANGHAVVGHDQLLERAGRSLSSTPRPFLRWAGSKQRVLRHIVPLLPKRYGTYFEPFLGSGALFFLLSPRKAVLSDVCEDLIDTYAAVRDDAYSVARHIDPLKPRKRLYYRVRDSRSPWRLKRAAEFIFLNKSCWNGLYRVNADGEFNVPFGAPATDFIVDPENLRACSKALRPKGVRLKNGDFERVLDCTKKGDFAFLDPPYVTGHNNNGFIDWNETLFSWDDQERLAKAAKRLVKKGVRVVVANANHREVLDLYRGFHTVTFSRSSTLASNSDKRKRVSEVLLTK